MLDGLFFVAIGIIGIFAGRFFKKFAEKQKEKMEQQKRDKEQG